MKLFDTQLDVTNVILLATIMTSITWFYFDFREKTEIRLAVLEEQNKRIIKELSELKEIAINQRKTPVAVSVSAHHLARR